ncbi:N-6 DNA methylase [Arcicella sp. DC2W]|uniref:N-6 DNA methylase n=1 Tax=Arcicella gelida TaxID=2984195 RepID=A0ABU5S2G9_9BACT|nr:N-6 DNA methylase [Arcicella sp. DC2W]MEA5402596.1 N-6 DNA methylase [Arcicella sp. DC2W]
MTISRKKELGAFYTPNLVTDALCNWAILNKSDILLEPSFGGCNFLVSSINRLKSLDCKNPLENVFGYDIDSDAFRILNEKGLSGDNFLHKDFLKSQQNDLPNKVTATLGNPPFLPINKLPLQYRQEVLENIKFRTLIIDKRSSLWVYFIVHSLHFLKEDGKMAWIVPDSVYFTDYGKIFLAEISSLFSSVKLLRIKERFFYESGTHEKTCILLCEGFEKTPLGLEIFNYESLNNALADLAKNKFINRPEPTITNFSISNKFKLMKLGDIFEVRIGIVIGATKLLTLKVKDAEKSPYFPEYVYPLITKGKQLKNITINKSTLLQVKDTASYIIDGVNLEKSNYELYKCLLESIPNDVISNVTFQKRTHPFGYDDFRNPDAFLTYFAQKLPRLIENENKALNCSNSIHRLYLKSDYLERSDIIRFIAIQMFCNFLSNETLSIAREYGNNILKYEPSDAVKIPVLIPIKFQNSFKKSLDIIFEKLVLKIEAGKLDDASKIAKKFLDSFLF